MSIRRYSKTMMAFTLVSAFVLGVILITGSPVIAREMPGITAYAAGVAVGHSSSAPALLAKGSMGSNKTNQGSQGTNTGQGTGSDQVSGSGDARLPNLVGGKKTGPVQAQPCCNQPD